MARPPALEIRGIGHFRGGAIGLRPDGIEDTLAGTGKLAASSRHKLHQSCP